MVKGERVIPELRDIGALREVLPYGRYLTTLEEIEERFVPENDQNRQAIWQAFQRVTELVRKAYNGLDEVWIGGSFITSEPTPHDIDVVYLVDDMLYQRAQKTTLGQFVSAVFTRSDPRVPQVFDPLVDAFLVSVPPTAMTMDQQFAAPRGYWDQFWSKTRFEKGNNRWLYPASGYLEVIFDGYEHQS